MPDKLWYYGYNQSFCPQNMFPDERDKNLLKLLLYLLTINPRARIPAKQALMNPFFQEVTPEA